MQIREQKDTRQKDIEGVGFTKDSIEGLDTLKGHRKAKQTIMKTETLYMVHDEWDNKSSDKRRQTIVPLSTYKLSECE